MSMHNPFLFPFFSFFFFPLTPHKTVTSVNTSHSLKDFTFHMLTKLVAYLSTWHGKLYSYFKFDALNLVCCSRSRLDHIQNCLSSIASFAALIVLLRALTLG